MATRRDFRGADPRVKESLDEALDDMLAAYPGIEPKAVIVGKMEDADDSNTYGQTDSVTGEVRISSKFSKDFESWKGDLRQCCLQGSALRKNLAMICNDPARYTLIHEYGHVVATDLLGHLDSSGDDGDFPYRRIMMGAWHALLPDEVPAPNDDYLGGVPLAFAIGIYADEVTNDLSAYANASPQEFVAEAFAIYQVAGRGTSKIADYVHDELERLYVAKHGPRAAAA